MNDGWFTAAFYYFKWLLFYSNMQCRKCQIRQAVKHRTKCGTCRSKEYRKNNPLQSAYITLRYNAKRRGKAFDLTFEEFKEFAIATDYIIKKGKQKLSYTIDRIHDTEGYTRDNIQVLTNADNVKKEHRRVMKVKYEWQTREYWSADITPPPYTTTMIRKIIHPFNIETMEIKDGIICRTQEEYTLLLQFKKEYEEHEEFINACLATRQEMGRLETSSLKILNDYCLIEDFVIMYDQLLERLAEEYGIKIFEDTACNASDLPF